MAINKTRIALSIDTKQLKKIDFYVESRIFKNRSEVFRAAIKQILIGLKHKRLELECAKLDLQEEQKLADLGCL